MHLTIATAGHIDHGKSALVAALTGTHPDRLPEEQARGISIELGFAHMQVGEHVLSFVDVPGHERFVRTMLAGVGGVDAVLLVVAADESVMPQTREHLAICQLLDVPTGVVALTKCDLADEMLQAMATAEVRDLLGGTRLSAAEIVPVSVRTGKGLYALRAALVRCGAARRRRDVSAPARLPIDRVFSIRGFGTVATGTLWSGALHVEQVVELWPGGRAVRVRGLQVLGTRVEGAEAGQRVAVNLAAIGHDEVVRGDVLVGPGGVVASRALDVEVTLLADAPRQRHGARVHVHLGTAATVGRLLLPPVHRHGASNEDAEPRRMERGTVQLARLRLEQALPVRRGDRIVLRSYSPVTTIAGALVLDPLARPRSRHGDGHVHTEMTAGGVGAWLEARALEAGPHGLPDGDVAARCGISPSEADHLTTRLAQEGHLVRCGSRWVAVSTLAVVRQGVLDAVDAYAREQPLAGGVPRAALRALQPRRWPAEVVDHVLMALSGEGVLCGDDRVSRPQTGAAGGVSSVASADARVLEALEAAGLQGLTLAELEASGLGLDRRGLEAVLARLARAQHIQRVATMYVGSAHLERVREVLRELAESTEGPQPIEVGWFKERFGLTRRTAIPLLEWLDRARVTRRAGDTRVLLRP